MPRPGGRRDLSACEKPSSAIRDRVQRAREKQQTRFHSDAKVNCNARMGPRQIKRHCQLTDESQELIRVAMTELNLSARAYDRILKVSRTVADLAGSDAITPSTSAKPSNSAPLIGRFGSSLKALIVRKLKG